MARTLLTALILMTLTLTACGEEVVGGDCTIDADCSLGEVCTPETGACSPAPVGSCASAAECAEGERCEGATATTRGMCAAPAPSCADQADPNAFCAAKASNTVCDLATRVCVRDPNAPACVTSADCGADKVCTTLGGAAQCVSADCSLQPAIFCNNVQAGTVCDAATRRCVFGTVAAPRYIMIEDMSSGASSCDSRTADGLRDAGSDITFIELTDAQGTIIGHGRAVELVSGNGLVDTTDFGIFDGTPRPLNTQDCPVDGFTRETVVSLGCGGQLFVELLDAQRSPLALVSGLEVIVGEYAPYCNTIGASMTGTDRYSVFLCGEGTPEEMLSNATCDVQLGAPIGGPGAFAIR